MMSARYVLRDLPGVADLERLLTGCDQHPNPLWAPANERASRLADQIALDLFGITDDDVPREHIDALDDNPEAAELLAQALGWGISDRVGETLMCFAWLAGPLIYASRGFGGHLPDPDRTASVAAWEIGLRQAAEAYRSTKLDRSRNGGKR